MVWVRRLLASFLSAVFLVCLLGAAFSTASNSAFAHPQKIETWLTQSNLYDHFIANAVNQAEATAGSNTSLSSTTLSASAIQQAANQAFTSQSFQENLNTVINSNYAWLEGKTSQPSFTLNLASDKLAFANNVGKYIRDQITGLPVCNQQQLAALGSSVSTIDPLTLTCRPPTLDAQAEANLVAQDIYNSGNFLSNPVITANNISPNSSTATKPYYQKYSKAPKLYQAAVKLPWVYGLIALVSGVGVVLLANKRRSGVRAVAGTLLSAGIITLIIKLLSDTLFKHLEKHVFNQTTDGQLQQALTQFFGKIESQMSSVEFWFVIGYIVAGLAILIALLVTRDREPKKRPPVPQIPSTPEDSDSIADRLSNTPRETPNRPPEPLRPSQPRPPKRPPRLIQ